MAYIARFSFVGEPIISKKSNDSFVRKWKGGANKDTDMASIRFGVKESRNNSMWVEGFGVKYDTIMSYDKDGNQIEVPWDSRFDSDIISDIPNYRLFTAEFDEGEKHFLSKYDFIEYLEEKLTTYSGKIFCSGRYSRSFWKGEMFDKFEVETVRASTAERNSLHLKLDLYYNKECIDKSEFKDKKRIIVDGYIKQYINKDEGEKFVPQRVVLDVSKFDDSEQHQKYAKMLLMDIDIKDKDIIHLPWDCKVIRGVETQDFDPDMLTDRQKQQIECGIAKPEDFASAIGENIYEFRFFKQMLNGEFSDGPVDAGYTMDELQEQVYSPTETPVKIEEVIDESDDDDELSDTTLEDLLG